MAALVEFVGKKAVGGSSISTNGDVQRLNKYTIPYRCKLTSGFWWMDGLGSGSGTQKHKMTIYALDSNGDPGALLATSSEVGVVDGLAAQFVAFAFAGQVLEAQSVWIGLFDDSVNDSSSRIYFDTGPAGSRRSGVDTYSDGPLDPGNFTSQNTPLYTMYVEYIPNPFDASKHHVGLGESGQQVGLMLTGAYNEDRQRPTGIATEFGSENDLLAPVPSLSRWTQDDFSGGVYQRTWGKDATMIAATKGMVPTQLDRSVRTVPPMRYLVQGDASYKQAAGTAVSGFWIVSDKIYLMGQKDDATQNWLFEKRNLSDGSFVASAARTNVKAVALDREGKRLWHLQGASSPWNVRFIKLSDLSVVDTGNMPAGASGDPRGLIVSSSKLVAQVGVFLYSGTPNDAMTSVKWTKIQRLPGIWKDACVYNGLVYILLSDNEWRTMLVAFDGSNVLPVCEFPYNFVGECIESYAGRIYIGGAGQDYAGTSRYGEIYEVTASSLRLMRTFAPDSRIAGSETPPIIYDFGVHEGLLFLAHKGSYITAYDITTDAFYGGPLTYADTSQIRYLASGRERLMAYVADSGTAANAGVWRMANVNGDLSGGSHTSTMTLSDFGPEPDLLKRWAKLRVRTRYGSVTMEYSLDGGTNFTTLAGTETVTGDYRDKDFDLTALAASKQIQFRFSMVRTDVNTFTEYVAHTLLFSTVGIGKLAWSLTVAAVEYPEGVDNARIIQDYTLLRQQLRTWADAGTALNYTDIHGESHTVQVYDVRMANPVLGDRDASGKRELLIGVTLLEV